MKDQISVRSQPFAISTTSHNEVIVSLTGSHVLVFLTVSPKLQLVSSLQLDQECTGVAVCDGCIYVWFLAGKVKMMARNGNQMKYLYDDFEFGSPT